MKAPFIRRLWSYISACVVGFYASTVNRFQIVGAENLPQNGGTLITSNHISGYDTVFIPWAVMKNHPLQMVWAPAKEELFQNKFLGLLFASWGAFPVKRRRDVKAAKIINNLLNSEKVMLFPEGTRNKEGVLGKGNRGVGKLIYDNQPVVVPTALTGINRWKFPGVGQKGKITFGPPLDFSDLFQLEDCKETHMLIVERVMEAIARLLET